MENNPTLMTDPGIYLGKAEAVALAHLICTVNGRQLSACFCYTCSCLHKFLRIFLLMNKAVYSSHGNPAVSQSHLSLILSRWDFFQNLAQKNLPRLKKKATQYNTNQIKACMYAARRKKKNPHKWDAMCRSGVK